MAFTKVSRIQWAAARAMWESDPRITLVQIAESLGTTRQAAQKRSRIDGWRKREDMDEVARQAHERADEMVEEDVAPSQPRRVTPGKEKTAERPPAPPAVVKSPPETTGTEAPAGAQDAPPDKQVNERPPRPELPTLASLEAAMRQPPPKTGSHGLRAELPHIPPETPEAEARRIAHEAAVARRAEILTTHRKEWVAVRTLAYASIRNKDMEAARHVKTCAESLKIVQDGERKAWGLDTEEKKPASVQVIINRRAGVTIAH